MKITNVSCMQFAGVRGRHVSFTDGINVIYGKNESGKSTLVNLICRTLFQKAKLDRRSDREFFELYFPSGRKGGIAGDFVDGTVTFETEKGIYTLSKEWGADPRCTLSTPDGIIRDQGKIEEILKEVLLYGEGVYSELLFTSQRNSDVSLQTILDAARKTEAKQEIADAVSQAFAESDGISVDAIEQAVKAKIDEIAGKHWDFEREMPVRKAGRWASGLGEILKAYYELEDARKALDEISDLERKADQAASAYTDADADARIAEEAYHRFHTFASRLSVQSERKKTIQRIDRELEKITQVLLRWPRLDEALEKARLLQGEMADRKVLDTWKLVQDLQAEVSDEDREVCGQPKPEAAEFATVKKAQGEIAALENSLCGMNLMATVELLGGRTIRVTSLRTDEAVDISQGLAKLKEAVKIEIPDVMVMQLSPADVDVDCITEEIGKKRQIIREIFAKYRVETLEALEAYAQSIETARAKIESVNSRIANVLDGGSAEALEERCGRLPSVHRTREAIERDALAVCGGVDIATFITRARTVIDGYAAEYGSINDLKARAFDLDMERRQAQEAVAGVENIPVEYQGITDPETHLRELHESWKLKQSLREAALTEKTSAASKLDAYQQAHPEACRETVEQAERRLEQIRSLLNHWRHIEAVFQAQKEKLHNNPMQDIADRFAHYLGVISGGKVSSEFPDPDKLNMHIYSDERLLDYGKLSEGTKETVALAFRLAVLDHLFPNGGGVIVLDDPFTDMDGERTAQSCALIKECAKRHQVIFLTCREDCLDALEGNRILF